MPQAASKHLMIDLGAIISGAAFTAATKPDSRPPAEAMNLLVLGTSRLEIGAGG